MLSGFVRQFGCPQGPLGMFAGLIMATRPSNRKRNEWAVSLLEPHTATVVLEIGCGPGLALARMCQTNPALRVVGIDHSALMVATARRRMPQYAAIGPASRSRSKMRTMATDAASPRISLVIPAYNEAAFLPKLLDTVAAARGRYEAGTSAVVVFHAGRGPTGRG